MRIKYYPAEDIEKMALDIVQTLNLKHIKLNQVKFVRSVGSSSLRTVARCHGLSKIWQKSLGINAHYIIEVISERFDNQPEFEKIRVLIHELMHIPFSFGGGFKHHDIVNSKNVDYLLKKYKEAKNENFN